MRHYTIALLAASLLLGLSHHPAGNATELPLATLQPERPPAAPSPSVAPSAPTVKPPAKPAARPVKVANPVPPRYRGFTINRRDAVLHEKIIALTFDDGPCPELTPAVLQILARYKAKATFFVVGEHVQQYPALVRQTVAAGHEIGSHSFTHPNEEINAPHSARELQRTEIALESIAGKRPFLYRPPYGNIYWTMSKVAAAQGYCVVKWTMCGADGAKENAADIVRNTTTNPQPGDIVLLHDGRTHDETIKALPEILRRLTDKGYHFVTVTQLLRKWDAVKPPYKVVRKPKPQPRKDAA